MPLMNCADPARRLKYPDYVPLVEIYVSVCRAQTALQRNVSYGSVKAQTVLWLRPVPRRCHSQNQSVAIETICTGTAP